MLLTLSLCDVARDVGFATLTFAFTCLPRLESALLRKERWVRQAQVSISSLTGH